MVQNIGLEVNPSLAKKKKKKKEKKKGRRSKGRKKKETALVLLDKVDILINMSGVRITREGNKLENHLVSSKSLQTVISSIFLVKKYNHLIW